MRYAQNHTSYKPYDRNEDKKKKALRDKARTRVREYKQLERRIVAWDGEGYEKNGEHVYTLLMNSDGLRIYNPGGLSTKEIFEFLCNPLYGVTLNVIYVSSYDVNMWLKDLYHNYLAELWQTGKVQWHEWDIMFIPRKQFTVSKFRREDFIKNKEGKYEYHAAYSFCIWDVFGFFQSSFIGAIESWLSDYPNEALDVIKRQKARRDVFTENEQEEIEAYCKLEIDALKQLVEKLRLVLHHAGLIVKRWDGAGAIAAAMLSRENIKQHIGYTLDKLQEPALRAYGGGRIESLKYGTYLGSVYSYDIRSAYPHAMLSCPSMAHGKWICSDRFVPNSFGLWKIRFKAQKQMPFYPFFYRDKNGSIVYPSEVYGWYWTPEVQAAHEHYPDDIYIEEGWIFDGKTYPFGFIESMYEQRQQLKADGKAEEKVLKLGINSLYGKTVQHRTHDKPPPFRQIEWGGYITSVTRARLFSAAMQQPNAIIHMATDGIVSVVPLELEIGSKLGQWEETLYYGIVEAQAGVYWLYDRAGAVHTEHYRGYDRNTLDVDEIRRYWSLFKTQYPARCTRFVTLGRALSSRKQWKLWRAWHTQVRNLSLIVENGASLKRIPHPDYMWWIDKTQTPATALIETLPRLLHPRYHGVLSAMYEHLPDVKSLEIPDVDYRLLEEEEHDSFE
jgi:hypothetical protein